MVDVTLAAFSGTGFRSAVPLAGTWLPHTLAEPEHFSRIEVVLLVLGIVASVAFFFQRFWPILRNILHSKKDSDFSLLPIGRRVWDFFWEVLCQGKVIRQRPLPGLAHAFVFWDFSPSRW